MSNFYLFLQQRPANRPSNTALDDEEKSKVIIYLICIYVLYIFISPVVYTQAVVFNRLQFSVYHQLSRRLSLQAVVFNRLQFSVYHQLSRRLSLQVMLLFVLKLKANSYDKIDQSCRKE